MKNDTGTMAVAERRPALVKSLAAALVVAFALMFSSAWAPVASATEVGTLAASGLQVSGNTITYTQTSLGYQVIPVQLQAGAVKLDFVAGASSAQVGIYASADDSGTVSGRIATVYANDPYGIGSNYGNVAKSGTYYVMFYASKYSGKTGSKAVITQYPYAEVKTANLNEATLGTGCGNKDTVAYYKINVKKRGLLTLNVVDMTGSGYSSSVALCNAKKTSLIGTYFPYTSLDKPVYFGVKPGTYLIAVKSYATLYNVVPQFTAVTKAVKAKKSKAVKISKGKKLSAVMAAGEKTAWYKFKVTKKKKYKIALTGYLNNSVKMTFSGKGYYSGSSYLPSGANIATFKTNKLKPGTYYVKVTTTNKGNGLYTITWK